MTREEAKKLLTIYGEAWMKRDADLIISLFTPDATYFDPSEGEQKGHEGIRAYWKRKVVDSQRDIVSKLLNVWVDEDMVIGEWVASFTDIKRNLHVDLKEIGIFEVREGKFSSLREYYSSTKKGV